MTTRNLFQRPELLDNQTRLIISADGRPRRLTRSAVRSAGQHLIRERSDSVDSTSILREIDDVLDESNRIQSPDHYLTKQISFIANDVDYDTDIDDEKEQDKDRTGKGIYIEQCNQHKIVPSSYFLRHLDKDELVIRYGGLKPINIKVMVPSLKLNGTIRKLDLRDNALGSVGAVYIARLLKENGFIEELNLGNNDIGLQGCKALCRALNQNISIRIVHLDGNRFNDDCAPFIADVLAQNDYITYMNLSKNFFENETTGRLFGQSLIDNHTLGELHLDWNRLNSKACGYILKELKTNTHLKILHLSWNGASLFTAKIINDLLKVNTVLEELHLDNNKFNTECATYIGKGLAKNETLKILTLSGNPLESSGCYAVLRPLLKHPTSQLQLIDFRGIIINEDFLDLLNELSGVLPQLVVKAGSDGQKETE